jgi:hypothetical protein
MDNLEMLKEKLGQTVEIGGRISGRPDVATVERFDQKLRTLDSLCRETFQ